jgi:5-methylcytosine-specific restriction enzyme A
MKLPTLGRKARDSRKGLGDSLTPPADDDLASATANDPISAAEGSISRAADTQLVGYPVILATTRCRRCQVEVREDSRKCLCGALFPASRQIAQARGLSGVEPDESGADSLDEATLAATRDIGTDTVEETLNAPVSEASEAALTADEILRRMVDPMSGAPSRVRVELARDQRLRWRIFDRDGYRCRHCGASGADTDLTIDHIQPVSRGGTNAESNLQTLCRSCNSRKGTSILQNVGRPEARHAADSIVAENEAHFAACRRELADPNVPPEARRGAAGAIAGYEVWTATRAHDAAVAEGDLEAAAAAGRDITAAYAALDAVLAAIDGDKAARR